MYDLHQPNLDARGLRLGLAVSRYHAEITTSMKDAAIEAFTRAGGNRAHLRLAAAAGTYELTAICRSLALLKTRDGGPALDGIVAIGCLIAGETTHDRAIADSVTYGLAQLTIQTGMPIGFGVLTCQTLEQARARSLAAPQAGLKNKGEEALLAVIETIHTIRAIETSLP